MEQLNNLKLLEFVIKKDYASIENYLKTQIFDFNSFKDFIDENQLSGNLYSALSVSYFKNLFPVDLMEYFKSFYIKQWAKNEQLIKEIERLSELFMRAGKEIIFLKGPFFAQRFYGDIDRRVVSDLDILVNKKDVNTLDKLLIKNSFKRHSIVLFNKGLTIYFTHHFVYCKQDIILDLHWALENHFSFNLNYKKMWKEKEKFIFKDKPFYVLSDEYELILQTLSIFRDIQLGTLKLKLFMDTYMVLKSVNNTINWEDFFINRENENIYLISLNILDLVLDIFNCREDFIELSKYIKKNEKYLDKNLQLLDCPKPALKNKLWAFRLYRTSFLKSFCWWIISLPFRLGEHPEWFYELRRK